MRSSYLFYVLILGVALVMIWIVKESFTQPGIKDLEIDFEEMAFYRNENNTGPVIRVYVVYAADTLWNTLEQYGDYMPHTKYGNTKVFFFMDKAKTPNETFPEAPYFSEEYQSYCVASYEKSAMGGVKFARFPFVNY
ncbi:hypothetical protein [Belliella pelovolcani]|uniref:Uncharacterized protein n=1 Tax=Belliella pelovolcani TaxID=529505 RepID=A0A1N7NKL5_9BACT|nr:hypothetical protein [Belliella pelovolcani]SIS98810.1 hypothetical protein SAMN05421761_110110 [Belliella pelovolcani]